MSIGSKRVHCLLLLSLPLLVFSAGAQPPKAKPSAPEPKVPTPDVVDAPQVDSKALLEALEQHKENLKAAELREQERQLAAQYYGYGSYGAGSYAEPTEGANTLGDFELQGLNEVIGPQAREQDGAHEQLFEGNADGEINEAESNFFELPSTIGQTAGLAVDKDQNLVLFHRSGRVWDKSSFSVDNHLSYSLGPIPNATIVLMDPQSGKVLGEHGANLFYMPHGLTIDHEGHIWVTDVGSHQVHKLDKKTFKPVFTLGESMVPGADAKHFCKPTDVAVAKNGDFFVADGYCNSRVMKFNKEGKLLASFGQPNSDVPPKVGEFRVPHSLALIEDLNLLCVADRENERIQCFAAGLSEGKHFHPRAFVPTGTFFTKAEHIGRVFAIREKQHYLVGVTNRDESESLEPQVFVMDMNTGRANTFAKGLENAHAVALSDNGDIYVSQINPNQIVKFSVPIPEV